MTQITNLEIKNIQNFSGFSIVKRFHKLLDNHVNDLLQGCIQKFYTLKEISRELLTSQQHLSDTAKKISRYTPCYFYDQKIISEAQKMLLETEVLVAEITRILTYL